MRLIHKFELMEFGSDLQTLQDGLNKINIGAWGLTMRNEVNTKTYP